MPLAVSKTGVFAEWYADQRFCHPGVLVTPDEAAQAWSLDDAHPHDLADGDTAVESGPSGTQRVIAGYPKPNAQQCSTIRAQLI